MVAARPLNEAGTDGHHNPEYWRQQADCRAQKFFGKNDLQDIFCSGQDGCVSHPEHIRAALEAAESPVWLESPDQVSRAAETWRNCGALALDTEFVRERTYHANLGLVQLSDGETVWLLDPLVEGNLEPLAEFLADRQVAKIVHSPSEDFEVLLHATGALPDPVLDTQIACAMLGQPLQTGYHTAVEWLLDVAIDKDQTRSNWCARPLRPDQLRYAALDVCLLPLMWRALEQELERKGRTAWFLEDCARQLELARVPNDNDEAWRRIRGAGRLDGVSLAILGEIAAWREQEARRKNRPRGFIMPDPVLLAIAGRKILEPAQLETLESLHPRARERYGPVVTDMVRAVLESGKRLAPIMPLTARQRKMLNNLRTRVMQKAEAREMEAALLAPRRDLEELIRLDGVIPARLRGWRHDVLTEELVNILEGEKR
jgi:ribonuclease D